MRWYVSIGAVLVAGAMAGGGVAGSAAPNELTLRGILREEIYIGTGRRYVVGLDSGETMVIRAQNAGQSAADRAVAPASVGEAAMVRCPAGSIRLLTE